MTAINYDNLHELINRYENDLDLFYGPEHDELFKWRAVKTWQDEWTKPEDSFSSFAERFNAAKRGCVVFIDNSRMHPTTGVIKLWEKEQEEVEHLFYDVLFADPEGDIIKVHDRMDGFLEGYEKLRQKYYPGNWSYKQDSHSASVFLAMNDPEFNFVFKSSEAHLMAKYIEFGLDIGQGGSFSLVNYNKLCEEIVEALKEHGTLLEKHFARLDDRCYIDKSLHLLAFDVMYCCRACGLYKDLTYAVTGKVRKSKTKTVSDEDLEKKRQEKLARIAEIEQRITELENSYDGCEDISLIGVEVTYRQLGKGVIIEQDINKIKVRFDDAEKDFILDSKYLSRPRFEDDKEIIKSFTAYGRAQEEIMRLEKELSRLQQEV